MVSDIIYHYCSSEIFHKIIQTKEIWLSNARFMNDLHEGKYIRGLIHHIAAGDEPTNFATNYERIYGEAYVACFSEKKDLLSLWERYADACRGFAIGYNKAGLEGLLDQLTSDEPDEHDRSEGINLLKVDYPEKADELYNKLKEECPSMFKKIPNDCLTMDGFINQGFSHMLWTYKNPFFVEECEHRIIYIPGKFKESDQNIRGTKAFRPTRQRICDHFPLKFSAVKGVIAGVVAEVVIGPLNTTEKSVAKDYLTSTGFPDTEVTYSKGCGVISLP